MAVLALDRKEAAAIRQATLEQLRYGAAFVGLVGLVFGCAAVVVAALYTVHLISSL